MIVVVIVVVVWPVAFICHLNRCHFLFGSYSSSRLPEVIDDAFTVLVGNCLGLSILRRGRLAWKESCSK